jgi:hypothetical protein
VLLLQRLASWLEHANITADFALVSAHVVLGVLRTPFAMTWPYAVAAGAAVCKRFREIAWNVLWGAVEREILEVIFLKNEAALPSAPLPCALSSSAADVSNDPSQVSLDPSFPTQEPEEEDHIELDLNIDNDHRKKSAKGDKGRVIMFDIIESMLQRVTVKDLAQHTAAVRREYLSGGTRSRIYLTLCHAFSKTLCCNSLLGTVTRIEGHSSDVRLKSTDSIDLICQLLSVFAVVPQCAEAHSQAFVKLFVKLCERLIGPIEFSQASRQVFFFAFDLSHVTITSNTP